MARKNFTDAVKREAIIRASKSTGFPVCEAADCGVMIKRGETEFDHILADTFGGKPTLDNCAVLCRACHRKKTSTFDVPAYIRKPSRWATAKTGPLKQKIGGQIVRRD